MPDHQTYNRILELARRAEKQRSTVFTDFLSIAEQSDAQTALHAERPPVDSMLFGGAQGCERQMIRFSHRDTRPDAFPIACVRIRPAHPKFAQALTHRDVLGALMSLGFERSLLGDIVVRETEIYVFCRAHIAGYICESLHEISRTAVSATVAEEIPAGTLFQLQQLTVQASSERIDAVSAKVFKLSRDTSQKLFAAGKVLVGGRLCESTSYMLKPDDLVSVRGYGRFRFMGIVNYSKKGKANLSVGLYV